MMSPLRSSLASVNFLGAIAITGSDANAFLQGQLSNDLQLLSTGRTLLASCNSAQGRAQVIARVVQRHDSILMLVPSVMVEQTMLRLRKYVLRSKVVLTNLGAQLVAYWPTAQQLQTLGLPQPNSPEEHIEHDGMSIVRWPDPTERYLLIGPAGASSGDASEAWRLADIRAGLAQLYPPTHEAFVAQMLNLDLVGGISFEKGCYTGQEIIARTHFRGMVKRRLFRFAATSSPPPPGTRVVVNGTHAGDVVDAVTTEQGCELLAVIALGQLDQQLVTEQAPQAVLKRLELPYEVTQ
jgi:folate-binding protein YgfZ